MGSKSLSLAALFAAALAAWASGLWVHAAVIGGGEPSFVYACCDTDVNTKNCQGCIASAAGDWIKVPENPIYGCLITHYAKEKDKSVCNEKNQRCTRLDQQFDVYKNPKCTVYTKEKRKTLLYRDQCSAKQGDSPCK